MTSGTSFIPAHPKPSTIKENPGPDVEVAALAPVNAAPVAMVMAAISSSVCVTRIEPFWLALFPPEVSKFPCDSRNSLSSAAGVIG